MPKAFARAAAERREAQRPAYPAVISGRSRRWVLPRGGPRVRRSAPAPVGALPPHFFERSRRKTKGHPPPLNGLAERWLFDNRIRIVRPHGEEPRVARRLEPWPRASGRSEERRVGEEGRS